MKKNVGALLKLSELITEKGNEIKINNDLTIIVI